MHSLLSIWPSFDLSWFSSNASIPAAESEKYALVIELCIIFILCCFAGALMAGVYLFYIRLRNQYNANRIANLEERYGLLLTGIIFDDETDEHFDEKRKKLITHFKKKYLRSRFNKMVLRKELLKLHKSLSGSSQKVLNDLYRELKLHKSALIDLNNTDWSVRADAVKELSQMQYLEAKTKILKLSTHENPVLRLEAQAAYLALEKENPFGFLEKAKAQITEWQQLNLEEIAKRLDSDKIPTFSRWFTHSNASVVEFCIKMTSTFNQFESGEALVTLLNSKHEKVIKESVKALGNLFITEAKDPLVELYEKSSPEIQNEIITSLGKLGGEEIVRFLKDILYTAPHEQAMQAGLAMRTIGYEGEGLLLEALQSGSAQASSIAAHMLDERI